MERKEELGEEDDDVTTHVLNFEKPTQKEELKGRISRDGPWVEKTISKESPALLLGDLGQDGKNEPNEYGQRELGSWKHIFSKQGLIWGKDLEEEKGGDGTYGDEELPSSLISSGEDEKKETRGRLKRRN